MRLVSFLCVLCQELLPIFSFKNICQQSSALADLERLTRITHESRSELDAGYFEFIREGCFGCVYKARKGKQDVAVKIVRSKEDRCLINMFEREADMLRYVQDSI